MSDLITDVLKLDWLSFSYKCDVDDMPDGLCEFDMFLEEFPDVKDLLQDSIILNRSRFYDNVLIQRIIIEYK